MRAKRALRRSGSAARTQRTAPSTPSSKACSQSASESSSSVPALVGPAAHTSALSAPQRRPTVAKAASTSAAPSRSARSARTSGAPFARSTSSASRRSGSLRARTATRQPSAASNSAVARPMPREPPATTTVAPPSPRSMAADPSRGAGSSATWHCRFFWTAAGALVVRPTLEVPACATGGRSGGPQGTSSSSAPAPAIRTDSRGAARRRAATPAREGRQHLLAHALDERRRVAGAARDGLADPDAHPHAPRNGEHVVREEPPGLVDRDRHDRHVGGGLEQREGPRAAELAQLARAGACPLGEDHRRDAARLHAPAELADRRHRAGRIAAVDEDVAAAAEVVRDARDPMTQRSLGDVLGEAPEEERAEERDVEHALVVGDHDVRPPRDEPGRVLDREPHAAQAEGGDQRHLERAGDVLLRPLAEEARDPLCRVEDEQDGGEDGQEGGRAGPGEDALHSGRASSPGPARP